MKCVVICFSTVEFEIEKFNTCQALAPFFLLFQSSITKSKYEILLKFVSLFGKKGEIRGGF